MNAQIIHMNADIKIIRSSKNDTTFCQAKFDFFRNSKISLNAKGIYAYLCQKKATSLRAILAVVPDPEEELRSGLAELSKYGYVSFDGIDLIQVIK